MTGSDIIEIILKFQLGAQIQLQELIDSGWRLDKNNSIVVCSFETKEMKGSSCVKNTLRSSATLNNKIDDKQCFLWSILANFHPCEKIHPNRVSNYREHFDELNIESFVFSDGFKCSDVHNFRKLNKLSIIIIELSFYQTQKNWKYGMIPVEIGKNDSVRVVDILI